MPNADFEGQIVSEKQYFALKFRFACAIVCIGKGVPCKKRLESNMQLNVTTDYAIRSMLYLAIAGRQASSSEISEAMCIPDNYLYSVMGKLKKAGLVKASRGVNGGWTLVGEPEDIKLLDVVSVMEGTIKINKCLADAESCNRGAAGTCQVHEFYLEVQEQLEKYFGSVSLSNLRDRDWVPVREMI